LAKAILRRVRYVVRSVAAILVVLMILDLLSVSATVSATEYSSPVPISYYGVTTLSSLVSLGEGTVNIQIATNSGGPFFIEKLLLFLQNPAQSDIILNSISFGGLFTYSFNSYLAAHIVVVPTGTTSGDIVSSLPSTLNFMSVKDPLGNKAIFASGTATNGLSFNIGYSTPLVGGDVNILVLVVAPTNATVTLTSA